MLSIYTLILVISYSFHLIIKSNGQYENCINAKTCGKCISTSFECFWCEDENFGRNGEIRCNGEEVLKRFKCGKTVGSDAKPVAKILKDEDFSKTFGATVQLKPQKYQISIRTNQISKPIQIHFKQADDYPMDLYYLMDLSCTMKKYKENLADVGLKLATKMKETTSDFKIGFGSFVDKPILPYSSYKIERLTCVTHLDSEPPYSFVNKLPLESNANKFVSQVKSADTSGNTDSPEGTLDALMQVLVCKKDIGWRDQSDKIIVVATDAEFHYAGDGKLGGILVPNDGECHMSGNNYTHWHVLDYPSMDQIAEKIRENKFNIIFLVSEKVRPIYDTLATIIGSTATVASLEKTANQEKDSTLVDLIDRVYKAIRSSVELRVDKKSDNIDIELFSKCETELESKKTLKCNFTGDKSITFDAIITMKSCPDLESLRNQKINIGLTNKGENVEIDLQLICECDCESSKVAKENSNKCSNEGTFACGICAKCNGIRTGDKCECDPDEPINANDPESHCKNKTSENTSTCSGRGKCICARCECSDGYSGKFCEFDDSNCYPNNNKSLNLCNGFGVCEKEMCVCYPGYGGKFCDCPTTNHTCIAPNSQSVCSDLGECKCGKCQCNKSSSTGTYCQNCPLCETQYYCDKILKCVPQICEEFYGKDNCTESCNNILKNSLVDKLETLTSLDTTGLSRHHCRNRTLDNECDFTFSYDRIDEELNASDLKNRLFFNITKATKHCALKVNAVFVSGGVVGGILLVGLALLLIWKLFTEIWDRKEFARFERELNKANWDQSENPLYKEVTTTFTNPTFGLRERAQKRISRFAERISRRFDINT